MLDVSSLWLRGLQGLGALASASVGTGVMSRDSSDVIYMGLKCEGERCSVQICNVCV